VVFTSPLKRIALSLLLISATAAAQRHSLPIPPSGVIGFDEAMLSPDYWIARAPAPNKVLMMPQQIDALNAKSWAAAPMMRDLSKIDPSLSREQVLAWMKEAGEPPATPVVDIKGNVVPKAALDAIQANAAADRIAVSTPARYGLSVRRAQLRTLPTSVQAFASAQLLDFDRFQGGILLPGEPVVIAHTSADGQWLLVDTATQGAAWVRPTDIAEGAPKDVFAYVGKTPYRVVTGDVVRTVFTPEAPELSELLLDMGTRLALAQLPAGEAVNGQVPYVSWPIELPVRRDDGTLDFKPALVQKVKDTESGYLPLTRANIIRQGFKFLGERYGWGHLYNTRDCSGFTSEVYRSMGIFLPPNAGAQGRGPFKRRDFSAADSHEARVKAVMDAQVGDLIVVPGHVLMMLGKVNGEPYVIQDVPYAVFRDPSGKTRMTKVNGVSVTPLLPLFADEHNLYVDAMTNLVHVTAAR